MCSWTDGRFLYGQQLLEREKYGGKRTKLGLQRS